MLLDRHRIARLIELSTLERTVRDPSGRCARRTWRSSSRRRTTTPRRPRAPPSWRASSRCRRAPGRGRRCRPSSPAGHRPAWADLRRDDRRPPPGRRSPRRCCSCCAARPTRWTRIPAIACPTVSTPEAHPVGAAASGARRLGHGDDHGVDRAAWGGSVDPAPPPGKSPRARPDGLQPRGTGPARTGGRTRPDEHAPASTFSWRSTRP
jgi:hypothetical protein